MEQGHKRVMKINDKNGPCALIIDWTRSVHKFQEKAVIHFILLHLVQPTSITVQRDMFTI